MGLLVVSTDVGGAPEVLPSALVTFAKELGLNLTFQTIQRMPYFITFVSSVSTFYLTLVLFKI